MNTEKEKSEMLLNNFFESTDALSSPRLRQSEGHTAKFIDISSMVDHQLTSREIVQKHETNSSCGDKPIPSPECLTPKDSKYRKNLSLAEPFLDFLSPQNNPISFNGEFSAEKAFFLPNGELGIDGRCYSVDQMNAMASSLNALSNFAPAEVKPKLASIPVSSIRLPVVTTLSPFITIRKEGKPKHQCQKCGKVFKRAHNLKIHGRLHSGIKPYGCPFSHCEKYFRWKSSIVSHLNWHRIKRGECLPGFDGTAAGYRPLFPKSVKVQGYVQRNFPNSNALEQLTGNDKADSLVYPTIGPSKEEETIQKNGVPTKQVSTALNEKAFKQIYDDLSSHLRTEKKGEDTEVIHPFFAPDAEEWLWGAVHPKTMASITSPHSGKKSYLSNGSECLPSISTQHERPSPEAGKCSGVTSKVLSVDFAANQDSTTDEKEWDSLEALLLHPGIGTFENKPDAGSSTSHSEKSSIGFRQHVVFPLLSDHLDASNSCKESNL